MFCCQFAPKLNLGRVFRHDVSVCEHVLKPVGGIIFCCQLTLKLNLGRALIHDVCVFEYVVGSNMLFSICVKAQHGSVFRHDVHVFKYMLKRARV